jgi:hypothetical protein
MLQAAVETKVEMVMQLFTNFPPPSRESMMLSEAMYAMAFVMCVHAFFVVGWRFAQYMVNSKIDLSRLFERLLLVVLVYLLSVVPESRGEFAREGFNFLVPYIKTAVEHLLLSAHLLIFHTITFARANPQFMLFVYGSVSGSLILVAVRYAVTQLLPRIFKLLASISSYLALWCWWRVYVWWNATSLKKQESFVLSSLMTVDFLDGEPRFIISVPGVALPVALSVRGIVKDLRSLNEAQISRAPLDATPAPRATFNFIVGGKVIGTGFRANFGRKTYIFTARHVFDELFKPGRKATIAYLGREIVLDPSYLLPAFDVDSHDVMVFHDHTVFHNIGMRRPLEMARWKNGSTVVTRGTQDGFSWYMSSGLTHFRNKKESGALRYQIQYEASTFAGWSGAPVMSASGMVVGLHVSAHESDIANCGVAITDLLFVLLHLEKSQKKLESFEEYEVDEWETYEDSWTRRGALNQNRIVYMSEKDRKIAAAIDNRTWTAGTWDEDEDDFLATTSPMDNSDLLEKQDFPEGLETREESTLMTPEKTAAQEYWEEVQAYGLKDLKTGQSMSSSPEPEVSEPSQSSSQGQERSSTTSSEPLASPTQEMPVSSSDSESTDGVPAPKGKKKKTAETRKRQRTNRKLKKASAQLKQQVSCASVATPVPQSPQPRPEPSPPKASGSTSPSAPTSTGPTDRSKDSCSPLPSTPPCSGKNGKNQQPSSTKVLSPISSANTAQELRDLERLALKRQRETQAYLVSCAKALKALKPTTSPAQVSANKSEE